MFVFIILICCWNCFVLFAHRRSFGLDQFWTIKLISFFRIHGDGYHNVSSKQQNQIINFSAILGLSFVLFLFFFFMFFSFMLFLCVIWGYLCFYDWKLKENEKKKSHKLIGIKKAKQQRKWKYHWAGKKQKERKIE